MIKRFQQILQSFEPYKVLTDLKVKIQVHENQILVPHPKLPNQYMVLDGTTLISQDPNCDIVACNILDYMQFGMNSYSEALSYLFERYAHQLQLLPGDRPEWLIPQLDFEFTQNRKHFNAILKLRENVTDPKAGSASAFLRLRHLGFHPEHVWKIVYMASGAELNELLFYTKVKAVEFPENKWFIVYPFMENWCSYAFLIIYNPENGQTQRIPLKDTRYGIFGLHSCLPNCREIWCHDTYKGAAQHFSNNAQANHVLVGQVNIGYQVNSYSNAFRLKKGIFIIPDTPDFSLIAESRHAFEKLQVYKGLITPGLKYLAASATDWPTFALQTFAETVATQRNEKTIDSLLQGIQGDRKLELALFRWLDTQDKPELMQQVKNKLQSQNAYNFGTLRIFETPQGYVAQKIGSDNEVLFTNFKLQIDKTASFPGFGTLHLGRILFGEQEYPLQVTGQGLRKIREIGDLVINALVNSGQPMPDQIPTVLDSSFLPRIQDILKQQIGKAPLVQGVHCLGWNQARNEFTTMLWSSRSSGIHETSRIGSPFNRLMDTNYWVRPFPTTENRSEITPEIKRYLALLTGNMLRRFLRLPTDPVLLLRQQHSVRLMQAMFMPFGQKDPISLGGNRRNLVSLFQETDFHGYPVFLQGPMDNLLEKIQLPIFHLTDIGNVYAEPISAEQFSQIASYSLKLIQAITVQCLRQSLRLHDLITTTDPKQALYDGCRIIQTLHDPAFSVRTPCFPRLYAALEHVTIKQLKDICKFDLETNQIHINSKDLKIPALDLLNELTNKNSEGSRIRNIVSFPADFIREILSDFYSTDIQFFHSESTEVDDEEETPSTRQRVFDR